MRVMATSRHEKTVVPASVTVEVERQMLKKKLYETESRL
jgi:hypothetical protein